MAATLTELRMRRLRHRITQTELARRIGCDRTWIIRLELEGYNAPAIDVWAERISHGIDEIVAERRAAKREGLAEIDAAMGGDN